MSIFILVCVCVCVCGLCLCLCLCVRVRVRVCDLDHKDVRLVAVTPFFFLTEIAVCSVGVGCCGCCQGGAAGKVLLHAQGVRGPRHIRWHGQNARVYTQNLRAYSGLG